VRQLRIATHWPLARAYDLTPILDPFIGEDSSLRAARTDYRREVAGDYLTVAHSLFSITDDIASCDFALLPSWLGGILSEPDRAATAAAFCARANDAGKVVLVDCRGDDYFHSPWPGTVLLHNTGRASRRAPAEVTLPAWVVDPGDCGRRDYSEVATVGFCGTAPPTTLERRPPWRWVAARAAYAASAARSEGGLLTTAKAHFPLYARARAIKALRATADVRADLVLRASFTSLPDAMSTSLHAEFIANLSRTDYTLAARGKGNFSMRLYETLAAGRIPVLVDTDSPLPLPSRIAWADHVVWVPGDRLSEVGRIVADFHREIGADGLSELQVKCRALWRRHLSMSGYLQTVHGILSELLERPAALSAETVAAALM
jgi:hypothetical protein